MGKKLCFWCRGEPSTTQIPCCPGAMIWQAAVVADAKRWLKENGHEVE
jgi:hypothetical protein